MFSKTIQICYYYRFCVLFLLSLSLITMRPEFMTGPSMQNQKGSGQHDKHTMSGGIRGSLLKCMFSESLENDFKTLLNCKRRRQWILFKPLGDNRLEFIMTLII